MKNISKKFENLMAIYPLIHFVLVVSSFVLMVQTMAVFTFALFVFVLYIQSPLIWFCLKKFYRLKMGAQLIGKREPRGNLWPVSHYLQGLYAHFPFIERILMLIPGAYSLWLRLWGASIGKKVLWTPDSRVVDRPFLSIGDRCLIGNMTYISSHAIRKTKGKYLLYLKNVSIGSDVVTGFHSTLGPGAIVEDGATLDAGAAIYPNQVIKKEDKYERNEEFFRF